MDVVSVRAEAVDRTKLSSAVLLLGTLLLLLLSLVLAGAPIGTAAICTWFATTAALGALIVRRSGSPIGWLMQVATALAALALALLDVAREAALDGNRGPLVTAAAWAAHWLNFPAGGLFVYLFLLFPNGRLPGPRWRIATWAAGAGVAAISVSIALSSGPLAALPSIDNPLGIRGAGDILGLLETLGSVFLLMSVVAALASLVVRLRRTEGDERAQVKWLLYAAALLFLTGLFAMVAEGSLNELSFVGLLVGLFALPLAFTVALTKYRLYDIDVVVNRTIVYTILTLAIVVLYILIVGLMGSLLQSRVGLVPALIATGVVAVIFQPLRRASQDAVDRVMFGQRRDPYAALANLGSRLESTFDPNEVLPAIVETVARSLKLAYVAIEVTKHDKQEVAASVGEPTGTDEWIPLVYQGEEVGRLVVAPRKGDPLSVSDHKLLADLARSAGAAVHAVALTDALRRSRNELLATREEERRRLRRDLHDGLGPELAGISLGLAAALNLSPNDDDRARTLLTKVQSQADSATKSIRGLVDGLRPSTLDDLGLVGAIREKGTTITSGIGMRFTVSTPGELPELSAAVEVAALRIALEAVTNAARHSGGTSCTVTIDASEDLVMEIVDDGIGHSPSAAHGVGRISMRERAEEVGGTITYDSVKGRGTIVRAVLPLR
jgi:signal transduction histidine kinase